MKKLITLIAISLSFGSYAAGSWSCHSEDGSSLKAIVHGEQGSKPTQIKYKVREGKYKSANLMQFISKTNHINGQSQEEEIVTLAIKDAKTGELAMVISNGSMIDATGVYSVDCTFGY